MRSYQPVPLRKVIKTATDDMDGRLYEALMALPITDRGYINHSKFGWYLKKNAGRIADGYVIERVNSRERLAWKVDMVEDRAEDYCLDHTQATVSLISPR